MTTEDDFQRQLDANPDDFHTRLVFADWLQERGDERAEGYRALGRLRLIAHDGGRGFHYGWCCCDNPHITGSLQNPASRSPAWRKYKQSGLPVPWFAVMALSGEYWIELWRTRREAEDAAALAFAKLPPERRAELLAQPFSS